VTTLNDFIFTTLATLLMWLWLGSLPGAIMLVAVCYAIVHIFDLGTPNDN
jgi:hypothetical protein